MNGKAKFDVKYVLEGLRKIIPDAEENFKVHPYTALCDLWILEEIHHINTEDFIDDLEFFSQFIDEKTCDKWIRAYGTFILYGGSKDDINHIKYYNVE